MIPDKLQQVVVGNATFLNSANKRLINSKKIKEILDNEKWCLPQDPHDRQVWKTVFREMILSKAIDVRFDNNQCPQLLKQIKDIDFNNLGQLHLDGNKIQNIEPLTWINLPNLYHLIMSVNNICSIKSLTKISTSRNIGIAFQQNPICQLGALSRNVKLKYSTLFLEGDLYRQGDPNIIAISQDLSFLFKLSLIPKKFTLTIHSNARIQQEKLKTMLKNKVSQIKIAEGLDDDDDDDDLFW